MLGVGGRRHGGVAVHEGGAVVRGEQPLVRIDAEAVGTLEPAPGDRRRRRAQRGRAVGAVDVQPEPVLGADVGGGVELVDRAGVGGAAVGDDGEHAVGPGLGQCGPQRVAGHPAPLVWWDEHDVDVHHVGRGMDRRVRLACRDELPSAAWRVTQLLAGAEAGR